MNERSAAFTRLCDAALTHFAAVGYDAASLNTIAEMIGIRKASLYSHIKGKDELYLLLLADALQVESAFIAQCFSGARQTDTPGGIYVEAIGPRFAASHHLQFLLKAGYFPPARHRDAIAETITQFLGGAQTLFVQEFKELCDASNADLYAEAWIGIVDSICVELLYGTLERTTVRKDALMAIFRNSLKYDTLK